MIGVTFQENGAEGKIDGEDEEGDATEQTQVGEQAQNDAEGEGCEIGHPKTQETPHCFLLLLVSFCLFLLLYNLNWYLFS